MLPNPQEAADLVTFTEEILNGKLNFLCSELSILVVWSLKLIPTLLPISAVILR